MSIFCLGLNHRTAPVEIRERLAFAESSIPSHLDEIRQLGPVAEAVVLSTCNRVEIYGAADEPDAALDEVLDYLLGHFEVTPGEVEFYRHQAEAAAHHLFEVTSGLDSMVLGETEIFGQVKKAYSTAQKSGATSKRMNKLFQQSFTVGKLIRSNTRIQQGSTSVGAAAVDLAEKIFGRLDGCRVMIIGAGEMSRITAQSLKSRGADSIIVSNRSFDKAEKLAIELEGKAIRFDDWADYLKQVDILISSTGAPHTVVKKEDVERALGQRRGHPHFLIDIAVPRDIDEAVNELDNVYLYNIDQLQRIAEEGIAQRQKQIEVCRGMIREFLAERGIEALSFHKTQSSQVRANVSKEDSNMNKALVLGTRGSDLALAQARMVEAALRSEGIEVRTEVIKTIGDKRPDLKLSEFSQGDNPVVDKGIFTKELEEALLRGEIDFAVHSLKDVPTRLGEGFEICATLPRADIADVLLTMDKALAETPGFFADPWEGKTIATSAVRRASQLRWLCPGIEVVDIRGNVPTRIRKLTENASWDGILLARAGIERLGIYTPGSGSFEFEGKTVYARVIPITELLPAAGQGAVAMEIRSENEAARDALRCINHAPTFSRITAERAFLDRLGAGCQTPVGVVTQFEDEGEMLAMSVRVFNEKEPHAEPFVAQVKGSAKQPAILADQLMEMKREAAPVSLQCDE
ncbi:MAG: glutamyl-tRNA reductase [Verrucomicrobiota bacterium]